MTAILINQERPVFSPNLLDNFCRFDKDYTWNEVSGATNGIASNMSTNPAESYSGNGYCRVSITGTGYYTFNNPDGGTNFLAPFAGRYIVSLALRKSQVGLLSEFIVTAFVNGIPNEYVCDMSTSGGHIDGQWNTYYFVLNLSQFDSVDFNFTTKGNILDQAIDFDRFKIEADDKNLFSPAIYSAPAPDANYSESRTDTVNTQNLTASIDNAFFANGTNTVLIKSDGRITPRLTGRHITVDASFDVLIPSGSNNFVEIKFIVGGVTYRNSTVPFLRSAGQTQHISVSFTFPVGWDVDTDNLTVKLNPTANCTISNRYLSVVEYV